MNEKKRNEVQSELKKYNDAAKSFEKKSGRAEITADFANLLLHRLTMNKACDMNENGGFVTPKIIKAKFHADYVIALHSQEKKNDFIFSSDTDFCAILGGECILIEKF